MDRALERIKMIGGAVHRDIEGLSISVAAAVTGFHFLVGMDGWFLFGGRQLKFQLEARADRGRGRIGEIQPEIADENLAKSGIEMV